MKVEARKLKAGDVATMHCGCRWKISTTKPSWWRHDYSPTLIPVEEVSLCFKHRPVDRCYSYFLDTEIVDFDPLANALEKAFG